jgi:hypothetical protein
MSKITINNEFYNGHKVLQKSEKTNSYRFHIEKLQEHYDGDFNNLNLEVEVPPYANHITIVGGGNSKLNNLSFVSKESFIQPNIIFQNAIEVNNLSIKNCTAEFHKDLVVNDKFEYVTFSSINTELTSHYNSKLNIGKLSIKGGGVTCHFDGKTEIDKIISTNDLSINANNDFIVRKIISLNKEQKESSIFINGAKTDIQNITGHFNKIHVNKDANIGDIELYHLKGFPVQLFFSSTEQIKLGNLIYRGKHKLALKDDGGFIIIEAKDSSISQECSIKLENVHCSGKIAVESVGKIFIHGDVHGNTTYSDFNLKSDRDIEIQGLKIEGQKQVRFESGREIKCYGGVIKGASGVKMKADYDIYAQGMDISEVEHLKAKVGHHQYINNSEIDIGDMRIKGNLTSNTSKFQAKSIDMKGDVHRLNDNSISSKKLNAKSKNLFKTDKGEIKTGDLDIDGGHVAFMNTLLSAENGKINAGKIEGLAKNQDAIKEILNLRKLGLNDSALSKIVEITDKDGTVPDFINLTDIYLKDSQVDLRYAYLSRNVKLGQAKGDFIIDSPLDLSGYDSFAMKTDNGKFSIKGSYKNEPAKGSLMPLLGNDVVIDVSADIEIVGANITIDNIKLISGESIRVLPLAVIKTYLKSDGYESTTKQVVSSISAKGEIDLEAKQAVDLISAAIEGQILNIKAKTLNVGHAHDEYHEVIHRVSKSLFTTKVYHKEIHEKIVVPSVIKISDNITLNIDSSSNFQAAQVMANNIIIESGNIKIKNSFNVHVFEEYTKKSSFFSFDGGFNFFSQKLNHDGSSSKEVVPTIFSANGIFYGYSQDKIHVLGSLINGNDIYLTAPKGIKLEAAPNYQYQFSIIENSSLGIGFSAKEGAFSIGAGVSHDRTKTELKATIYSPAILKAANDIHIDSKDGNLEEMSAEQHAKTIEVKAKNWIKKTYDNEIIQTFFSEHSEVGFHIGLKTPLPALVKKIENFKLFGSSSLPSIASDAMKVYDLYKNLACIAKPIQGGAWVSANYSSQSVEQTSRTAVDNVMNAERIIADIDGDINWEGFKVNCEEFIVNAKNFIVQASSDRKSSESEFMNFGLEIPIHGSIMGGAGFGFQESSMSSMNYRENYIKVKGKVKINVSQDAKILSVTLEGGDVEINAENLILESLQDKIAQNMSGLNLSVSYNKEGSKGAGFGIQDMEQAALITEQIAQIIGRNVVKIVVGETLNIAGGIIANADVDRNGELTDKGDLSIECARMIVKNLHDFDDGKMLAVGMGAINQKPFVDSASFGYTANNSSGKIMATIGNGELTSREGDISKLNRDINSMRTATANKNIKINIDIPVAKIYGYIDELKKIKKGDINFKNLINNFTKKLEQHIKELPGSIVESIATNIEEAVRDIGLSLDKIGISNIIAENARQREKLEKEVVQKIQGIKDRVSKAKQQNDVLEADSKEEEKEEVNQKKKSVVKQKEKQIAKDQKLSNVTSEEKRGENNLDDEVIQKLIKGLGKKYSNKQLIEYLDEVGSLDSDFKLSKALYFITKSSEELNLEILPINSSSEFGYSVREMMQSAQRYREVGSDTLIGKFANGIGCVKNFLRDNPNFTKYATCALVIVGGALVYAGSGGNPLAVTEYIKLCARSVFATEAIGFVVKGAMESVIKPSLGYFNLYGEKCASKSWQKLDPRLSQEQIKNLSDFSLNSVDFVIEQGINKGFKEGLKLYGDETKDIKQKLIIGHHLNQQPESTALKEIKYGHYAPYDQRHNFSGKGTNHSDEHSSFEYKSFTEYYSDGIDNMLLLRIKELNPIINQNLLVLNAHHYLEGNNTSVKNIISEIQETVANSENITILIPYNIEDKHWVCVILEKTKDDKIDIKYIDSENNKIPQILIEELTQNLEKLGYKTNYNQLDTQMQKYDNCGSEVVENFMYYLTGERFSQEDSIVQHSKLLEQYLLGEYDAYKNLGDGSLNSFDVF